MRLHTKVSDYRMNLADNDGELKPIAFHESLEILFNDVLFGQDAVVFECKSVRLARTSQPFCEL